MNGLGLRVGNGLGVRFNTFARTSEGFSVAGASVAGFQPGESRGIPLAFQLRLSPTLAPHGILESPFARLRVVCVCRLSYGLRVESVKKSEEAERHDGKQRAKGKPNGQRGQRFKCAFHGFKRRRANCFRAKRGFARARFCRARKSSGNRHGRSKRKSLETPPRPYRKAG